ncbi:MAG: hypothetical protein ABIR46_02745 [Candidatus Saccharimonadales bacterium]
METIPTGYLILIYLIIALPFLIAILVGLSVLVVAVLYFTNRRKTAIKIVKAMGITMIVLVALSVLTRGSLGV